MSPNDGAPESGDKNVSATRRSLLPAGPAALSSSSRTPAMVPSLPMPPAIPHSTQFVQSDDPPSSRGTPGGPSQSPLPPPPSSRATGFPPASLKNTLPSSVQKALVTLDKLKAKLDAVERQRKEPIAIVGMACRFPGGASSPESFFRLLLEGTDAVVEVPEGRWVDQSATIDAARLRRWGGFLKEDIAEFEPSIFGISPREAERLDPQQRILLELTWEALERAGQIPATLVGSRTGVYIGLMATDYMLLSLEAPPETWDAYTATGSAHCFPAGRIAYAFGFQGPALVVDTACSSSLVAVHAACQSLRSGETDMAIAGGMNLLLTPVMFDMTAKMNALAPDGRCKTFDARADGYVRGEGGGIIVLKRLSDAHRDGDPIFALVRGSAVNQDGRSTGLTTPNVLSQQAMLRQALSNAKLGAEDIGFVETHGTGTSLGDPIEVEALKAVLGAVREDGTPCVLGAVKTNIGHLEAAAGIAGIIKSALVLQKGIIPKNLHMRALNPRISLEGTPFMLPTENRRWEKSDKPRLAGVSSFGLSGTNAHVILEEAPAESLVGETAERDLTGYLLPLSAKSPEALRTLAGEFGNMLSSPTGDSPYDIAYTASMRRAHHEYRLSVTGRNRSDLAEALKTFHREGASAGVSTGKAGLPARQKIVFVFPGQGSQWLGMGRQLFRDEPSFRATMELCHEAIRRHGTFSLLDELQAEEGSSRLGEIDVVQPMLFAIQVSLAALWRSWGIEPDAVIGHSMGEVAAARVAGILSAEDAAKVICRRSRMLVRIAGQGAMAQVELSPQNAQLAIAGFEDRLSVAVHNGPRSTVLSGQPDALETVLTELESKGVYVRRVKVDVASHSPQVDILGVDLAAVLFNLRPRAARIPMFSTVTGEALRGPELTADYWVRNLRDPVLFGPVASRLMDDRQTLFVEISPHPILSIPLEETLKDAGHNGIVTGSLRRNHDERLSMLDSLGTLHVHGSIVNWKALYSAKGRCVQLPTYAWQRQRYWIPDLPSDERPSRRDPSRSRARLSTLLFPEWRKVERSSTPQDAAFGPWLILSDESGTGEQLTNMLTGQGRAAVVAVRGSKTRRSGSGRWEIDVRDPSAYDAVLNAGMDDGVPFRGVVHLFSLDCGMTASTEDVEQAQVVGAESALLLAQAALRLDHPVGLYLVTRGATPVPGSPPVNCAQAPILGLGRTLQVEHPELGVHLIDVEAHGWTGQTEALLAELVCSDSEDEVSLRRDGRFVSRVVRTSAAAGGQQTALRADGTYLITGGLGGLGISFAEWMVSRGARHVVLVGRSAPSQVAQSAIARMESTGARVSVFPADISIDDEVRGIFQKMAQDMPPLRGILHAAAVLDDHVVSRLSVTSMREVAAAKMYGAWHLHKMALSLHLDFFILFSSAASLLGSMGQGNYAAANAFLDSLAHARRAQGLPAVSINWGPFSDVGLAAAKTNRGERLTELGFRSYTPSQGHDVLDLIMRGTPPHVAAIEFDSIEFAGLCHASAVLLDSARWCRLQESEHLSQPGWPRAPLKLCFSWKGWIVEPPWNVTFVPHWRGYSD
ncbi:MAG: SDR family NAD(P)-dependent oxidoreductase [Polyangiaceae bacterium]|nr:SDR family NAD(P)-dependent oxidoreductase [Polyangiaceae bacterium]